MLEEGVSDHRHERMTVTFFRSSARVREAGATPLESRLSAFPPALPTLARVRLQRISPIGTRRNPPPRAENAANFFRSSARAAIHNPEKYRPKSMQGSTAMAIMRLSRRSAFPHG